MSRVSFLLERSVNKRQLVLLQLPNCLGICPTSFPGSFISRPREMKEPGNEVGYMSKNPIRTRVAVSSANLRDLPQSKNTSRLCTLLRRDHHDDLHLTVVASFRVGYLCESPGHQARSVALEEESSNETSTFALLATSWEYFTRKPEPYK